jgi:flagellar biosynthesis/type III secretory pathway protein FliH
MTSYSSIIKSHNLAPERVVVGLAGADPEPALLDGSHTGGAGASGTVGGPLRTGLEGHPLVMNAQTEAEAILARARLEAEGLRKEAQEKGFKKGNAEGRAAAKAEVMTSARAIAELARNAATDMERMVSTAEESLVELALSIAETVLYRRLAEDRAIVVSVVKGALEQVDLMDVIRVRANPEDLEILQQYWEEASIAAGSKPIELAADSRIQAGGCIIDTNSSVIDAQIETQLAEIEKAFRAGLESSAR